MLEEWRWFELSCSKSVRLLLYLFLPHYQFFSSSTQYQLQNNSKPATIICVHAKCIAWKHSTAEFLCVNVQKNSVNFFSSRNYKRKKNIFLLYQTLSIKFYREKKRNLTLNLADSRNLIADDMCGGFFFSSQKFHCVKEVNNFLFCSNNLRKYFLAAIYSLSFVL